MTMDPTVKEFLLNQKCDETVLCYTDDLIVDHEKDLEPCVICYRYPLSPRYVSVHCKKHIVCLDCGDRLKTCPLCRRRVQALYRNLDLRKINSKVRLRCPFESFGCEVISEANEWPTHIRSCKFEGDAWREYFIDRWTRGERSALKTCQKFWQKSTRLLRLRTFGSTSTTAPDFDSQSSDI